MKKKIWILGIIILILLAAGVTYLVLKSNQENKCTDTVISLEEATNLMKLGQVDRVNPPKFYCFPGHSLLSLKNGTDFAVEGDISQVAFENNVDVAI